VLIAYGSLAPGMSNHNQMDGLIGRWVEATIEGVLVKKGWGQHLGYPGLKFEPTDQIRTIECLVFFSDDLPDRWNQLDKFEGDDYERILISFKLMNGAEGIGNVFALKS